MSSIKLKHSGGNSVSLNPPTSAPTSSEVAFKLPNADGSANQLLKTDGSGNLGWATDQGGKLLQMVQGYGPTGETSTSSTSYVGTALSIDITPTASSSILLITVTGGSAYAGQTQGVECSLYRKIGGGSYQAMHNTQGRPSDSLWRFYGNGAAGQMGVAFQVKDADHNTTSAITYKVNVRSTNGGTIQFNNHHQDAAGISVMEISA